MSVLNPRQAAFTSALAKITGLNPKTIAAWSLAEESGSAAAQRAAQNNNNWLNVGYFDSGAGGLTKDKTWSDPTTAAQATAQFLQGKKWGAAQGIQDILKTVGKGPAAQLQAIAASPWASSHYGGGKSLQGTFKAVSGETLPLPDGSQSTVVDPASTQTLPAAPSLRPITPVGPGAISTPQGLTGGLTAGSFMEAALQTLGVKRHSGVLASEMRNPTLVAQPVVSKLPLPDGTPSTVTKPAMPTDTTGFVPGGGWGGSKNLATDLAKIGEKLGLKVTSEKRATKLSASGIPSDHWTGSKNSYAYDLSNGTTTPQEDRSASAIAAALGVPNWKGGVLNVTKGGYRYQVLYKTMVGGNHFNHVHVGVKKV